MSSTGGFSGEDDFGDLDLFKPDSSIDPRTAPQTIPKENLEASERSEQQRCRIASADFLNMPEGRAIRWIKHMPEPFRSQFPIPGDGDQMSDALSVSRARLWLEWMFGDCLRQMKQKKRLRAQDIEILEAWRKLHPVIQIFSLRTPRTEEDWKRYLGRTLLGNVFIGKRACRYRIRGLRWRQSQGHVPKASSS